MKKLISIVLAIGLLLSLTGCKAPEPTAANTAAPTPAQSVDLEGYLANVKTESDGIKAALEQEELTQTEMNERAKALSDLWDAALNTLLAEAQKTLPEAEWTKLSAEQSAWADETAKAAEAAGADYAGGSMQALVISSEAARLTEARVYALLELLK